MAEHCRSPKSSSAFLAAAPARLAEQHGGDAAWRDAGHDEIEVAVLQKGRLDRHLVHEDGKTTLIDSSSPRVGYRWGNVVAIVGWAWCGAVMALGAIVDPNKRPALGPVFMGAFVAGMALMALGGISHFRQSDLRERLKRRDEGNGTWHMAPLLSGWSPSSSEQLSAVEDLADLHEGVAYVRNDGGRTVDVLVLRKRRLDRYWVDARGTHELAESIPPQHRPFWPSGSLRSRVRKLGRGDWLEVRTRRYEEGD